MSENEDGSAGSAAYRFKLRHSMGLEDKIMLTNRRIRDWHDRHCGRVYVSFSGGKDSTVLLHLVRSLYPNVKAVFCNTGQEYPEILKFVKTFENVDIVKPKVTFRQVVEKFGWPVISKEVSSFIYQAKNTKSDYLRALRIDGVSRKGQKVRRIPDKWKYLLNEDIKISGECCNKLKKDPLKRYEKAHNVVPFIGMRADEGGVRQTSLITLGCNYISPSRSRSAPLSFWSDGDVDEYIRRNNIKLCSLYEEGLVKRTGCMACAFGATSKGGLQKFKILKDRYPGAYSYFMDKLGMRNVLRIVGVTLREETGIEIKKEV